ncbi:hypothetical protein HMPREF0972_01668 [Actinomyces sp. oral taxon 848 str. F0332]|nr:hypothetical protein HMPREF0972_01668 [Actinomyces sp. oral taxon 848 str. F0332]
MRRSAEDRTAGRSGMTADNASGRAAEAYTVCASGMFPIN